MKTILHGAIQLLNSHKYDNGEKMINNSINTNKDTKTNFLGEVLRLLRLSRNLTAAELAKKMNTSSSHITEIEAGNKLPSLPMLQRFSEALEVRLSTILYFAEENSENKPSHQELLLSILKKIVGEDSSKKEREIVVFEKKE